jgi:hypothetical protein
LSELSTCASKVDASTVIGAVIGLA